MTDAADSPIQDVLDEIIPDWREQVVKLRDRGMTDLEITTEFRRQMAEQTDVLLDLYNELDSDRKEI
jgi:hypothetical protein